MKYRISLLVILITSCFFAFNMLNEKSHDLETHKVIFFQNFSHRNDQIYTQNMFLEDFANCNVCNLYNVYSNLHQLRIKNGELAVTFKKNEIGTKLLFAKKLDRNYEELFLTFTVRFDQDYDQNALGGKLMGLGGTPSSNISIPVGCVSVSEDAGFSSRFTYSNEGMLTNYLYHQNKNEECGEANYIKYNDGTFFKFIKDKSYTLEMRVVMNQPGLADGFVETYVNGSLLGKSDGYIFSKTGKYGINTFLFNLYIGGKSDNFKLRNNSTLYLDNFIISTERVFNDYFIK